MEKKTISEFKNHTYKVIIKHIKNVLQDRKLLIWGAWKKSEPIVELLKENGIEVYGYIDRDKMGTVYNSLNVYSKQILEDSKDKYFVWVSLIYYEDVYDYLSTLGYRECDDYLYFSSRTTIVNCYNYKDFYGNEIIGRINDFKVTISGNSVMEIGENCKVDKNVKIELSKFSKLIIGNNCKISENTNIILKNNADVLIGDNCIVKNDCSISSHEESSIVIGDSCVIGKQGSIVCVRNSKINIGKKTRINSNMYMVANENSNINIGEDCTFSHYIKIRSNDGHGIFDIKNKKDITFGKQKSIKIGNHVWVGLSVTILYNSVIGNGSIIGANAFVKNKIPNNCISAGIPAKIIRKDIAWCSQPNIDYEKFDELYGTNEYIKCFTQELE